MRQRANRSVYDHSATIDPLLIFRRGFFSVIRLQVSFSSHVHGISRGRDDALSGGA
jgi:hypothetical protein